MFIATPRPLKFFFLFGYLSLLLFATSGGAASVPDDCTQLIVGIAADWDSTRGQVQLFERSPWSEMETSFAQVAGSLWQERTGLGKRSGRAG